MRGQSTLVSLVNVLRLISICVPFNSVSNPFKCDPIAFDFSTHCCTTNVNRPPNLLRCLNNILPSNTGPTKGPTQIICLFNHSTLWPSSSSPYIFSNAVVVVVVFHSLNFPICSRIDASLLLSSHLVVCILCPWATWMRSANVLILTGCLTILFCSEVFVSFDKTVYTPNFEPFRLDLSASQMLSILVEKHPWNH